MDYQKILKFWFSEMDSALWFKKDEDFDAHLRQHFGSVWQAASKGNWRIGDKISRDVWLKYWYWISSAEICSAIYPPLFPVMAWR